MAAKMGLTIVVTGATHGLGRALVDGFIREGHVVAGCGRTATRIDELNNAYADPHHFEIVDIADNAAVAAWAGRVMEKMGTPDFLVNNAALINRSDVLWNLSAEEFDAVVDVNIKGVTNTIRHFVPAMVSAGRGVIVNFSSGWGRSVSTEVAPYCATKWAVEGLSKALAEELPPGMASVPLNPGIVNTRMLRSCFGETASAYPEPADWARRAVPFILRLGPENNGQSLSIW